MTAASLGLLALIGWLAFGLASVYIYCSYRGRNLADDDTRPLFDQWRDEIAETPFAPADEAHVQEALELVRPGATQAIPAAAEREAVTDCRSEDGIIVGLIDGMIAQARIVAAHLRSIRTVDPAVREALLDLRADEDLALVCGSKSRECDPGCNLDPADDERHDAFGCLTDDDIAEERLKARDYESWARL